MCYGRSAMHATKTTTMTLTTTTTTTTSRSHECPTAYGDCRAQAHALVAMASSVCVSKPLGSTRCSGRALGAGVAMKRSFAQLGNLELQLLEQLEGRAEPPPLSATLPQLAQAVLPADEWFDGVPGSPCTPPLGPLLAVLGDPGAGVDLTDGEEDSPPSTDRSVPADRQDLDAFKCITLHGDIVDAPWGVPAPRDVRAVRCFSKSGPLIAALVTATGTNTVQYVAPGSVAEERGLRPWWVLTGINGERHKPWATPPLRREVVLVFRSPRSEDFVLYGTSISALPSEFR